MMALPDAALHYAALEWPVAPLHSVRGGVCSCPAGATCDRSPGKHPRTDHGLDDATTDPGVIAAWWKRWQDANIAIRCDRLFVLDVDPRHGGDRYLAELEAQHGPLPRTMRVHTGGGGWHHYFTAPTRRWRKTIAPGLDIQAGRGKYVLAPPSNHLSGLLYRIEDDAAIVPAPAWLVEAATRPADPPASQGSTVAADGLLEKRVRAYLSRCPPAVSGQGGHTHTLMVAQHVVRGFALDDDAAYSLLCEWNRTCDPPWSERDLRRKIHEARQKGSRVEWGAHLRDDRPAPSSTYRNDIPPPRDEDAPPPSRARLSLVEREPGSDDEDETPAPEAKQTEPRSTVEREWRPLDLAFLTTQPPVRRWLLRHPTRDGKTCPPNGGDGLLPLGKVGILASEGGIGKTNVVLALAVAIICGRRWLGHFEVDWEARRGRVFLGLAEEDAEEIHRRLYSIAEEYGLTDAERRRVSEQVVIEPLAGKPVALVGYAPDGRSIVATPELLGLRMKLEAEGGPNGWSLVALDPLARWAGADVEADSAVATRFVQALEVLTSVPGQPTVLVPHHSSKASRRAGSVDSRGVTAITDGSRWTATLRADGPSVYFVQAKSNYSRPMFEELRLLRGTHGLLHVATEEEIHALEAAKDNRDEERSRSRAERLETRIADMEGRILEALIKAKGDITSREQLHGLVTGDTSVKASAVTRLIACGRIGKVGGRYVPTS
jgi:hypothetical protein